MPHPEDASVAAHYSQGALLEGFKSALARLGFAETKPGAKDLAPIDEFHMGGLQSTLELAAKLSIAKDQHWLDVGCGVGGPARVIAEQYGCRVTGLDLVPDFIDAAEMLTDRVGLGEGVAFRCASALEMPFEAGAFDGAYMLHVAMNIADKPALFREVARVLKPGALFAVYDVMRVGEGELAFPLPWASEPGISFVEDPESYRAALAAAGFAIEAEEDLREVGLAFFQRVRQHAEETGEKPPISFVMGPTAEAKIRNVVAALSSGLVSPLEMIARKRG